MTASPRSGLVRAAAGLRALSRRVEACPLDHFLWLPPQHDFLYSTALRLLLRAGNQVYGKTTCGLAKIIDIATGEGRFIRTHFTGKVECWIITASWSQSVAIQQKLYNLLPKEKIHPDTKFDPIRGFRGKNPAVELTNGSIIRIKTTQQGSLNLAGATIHAALFDEPPTSARVYSEVQKRVLRNGGYVFLTLTPINAPVGWLQEAVANKQIVDLHYPLKPEYLIPVGSDQPFRLENGTVCDEVWIEKVIAETLPHEVPVVVDGEWECRVTGRVFTQFNEPEHVRPIALKGKVKLAFGTDHGSKIGKEIALLVAIDDSGEYERIYVLDEYVGGERTTLDQDARAMINMLERNGIRWRELDHAWGDRLYVRGPIETKSNKDLIKELSKVLKLKSDRHLFPPIRTVKKGAGKLDGSVDAGCTFLHQRMIRDGHFVVSPNCTRLIAALNEWDYTDSDAKDPIDALRYALQDYIFKKARRVVADVRA